MSTLVQEQSKINIFDKIKQTIVSLFAIEKTPIFTLQIPKNLLFRTELICKYISEEQNLSFDLENFLMLLYLDFIKNAIKKYNPEKVLKLLSNTYYDYDEIIISNGNESCIIDRSNIRICNLTISMDKNDVEKGQLILDEIYELYKCRFSFSRLLESLWFNFIESYKNGDNKKAYHSIIKLLNDCFN